MITKLQVRNMTNEQVLDVIKRACIRNNQKLIHAQYNPSTLELNILVDEILEDGAIENDVDSVLIGLCDLNFNPIEDTALNIKNDSFCPSTVVTCNNDIFVRLSKAIGGILLV